MLELKYFVDSFARLQVFRSQSYHVGIEMHVGGHVVGVAQLALNRTMLELKYKHQDRKQGVRVLSIVPCWNWNKWSWYRCNQARKSLNRTMLELKSLSRRNRFKMPYTLNRTMLELK